LCFAPSLTLLFVLPFFEDPWWGLEGCFLGGFFFPYVFLSTFATLKLLGLSLTPCTLAAPFFIFPFFFFLFVVYGPRFVRHPPVFPLVFIILCSYETTSPFSPHGRELLRNPKVAPPRLSPWLLTSGAFFFFFFFLVFYQCAL